MTIGYLDEKSISRTFHINLDGNIGSDCARVVFSFGTNSISCDFTELKQILKDYLNNHAIESTVEIKENHNEKN